MLLCIQELCTQLWGLMCEERPFGQRLHSSLRSLRLCTSLHSQSMERDLVQIQTTRSEIYCNCSHSLAHPPELELLI